ncbi:hypothetical protein [Nonomuraea cavernae]|uniref:Uncharacterized protein n=1 Tax=Nonomuraea cavernae TaxID=2045107 RepID=A0A917YNL7_9ACTN|nr:hypothetical protein [Nonomuraea cavernae]MCA2183576.1 hypothetical protein [Nonomuraea cavernae]GGO60720.1 hypothetical protein GCM10012289_01250 [Nonomuraea cavernae]
MLAHCPGAIVSHLVTGCQLGEVAVLGVLVILTGLSRRLRPAGRRMDTAAAGIM